MPKSRIDKLIEQAMLERLIKLSREQAHATGGQKMGTSSPKQVKPN